MIARRRRRTEDLKRGGRGDPCSLKELKDVNIRHYICFLLNV